MQAIQIGQPALPKATLGRKIDAIETPGACLVINETDTGDVLIRVGGVLSELLPYIPAKTPIPPGRIKIWYDADTTSVHDYLETVDELESSILRAA